MVRKAEIPKHVIDTTMELAAIHGWRRLSLAEIAEGAGLSLAVLYEHYPSKASILRALVAQTDARMLAAAARPRDEEESPRDRLFDVLMARFEALAPYRDGVGAVLRDEIANPAAVLCGGPRLLRSMGWALEAAGIRSTGCAGRLRAKGLAAVYGATMLVWLRDDTEDMSRTMAALDRRLAGAERLAALCPGGRRRARAAEPPAAEAPPGAAGEPA